MLTAMDQLFAMRSWLTRPHQEEDRVAFVALLSCVAYIPWRFVVKNESKCFNFDSAKTRGPLPEGQFPEAFTHRQPTQVDNTIL